MEVRYDHLKEAFILTDHERGLKFKVITESPRAVVILRRIWDAICDALSRRRTSSIKIKGMWVNLIPLPYRH